MDPNAGRAVKAGPRPRHPDPSGQGTSSGRGYHGECWKYGKLGHKQPECRPSCDLGEYIEGDSNVQEVVAWGFGRLDQSTPVGKSRATAQTTILPPARR